ncbi:hypothetical protein SAV58_001751 [Enterococcus faecalis]|nr:hypothetical protein [Enterococcus faecalis]EGO8530312.1 hypothetical protein [Enterococcus faecalis]EHB6416420.1 hypothetical protein [Enterococcus faecalis]ELS0404597.1 hypothetical protein [Enterococcus faecalis]ELT9090076.1 hypothetical protein [Enterococcus faecalis]
MTRSIKLNKQLRKAALKKGLSQKQVAQSVYFAHTTTNGHFNGYPVPPESAIAYNELFNDSELAFALGQELLGLIGLATGVKVKKEPLALSVLKEKEEREREKIEVENEIDYLMAIPVEELTEKQKQAILQYCSEYSDELLFEVSLICKQLELIGMSFMDLMILRTPYWKNKEWIE